MLQSKYQAKAEFDFDAQPGSGELTIRTGEILAILREGIEGGWVEGRNTKGKVGLFPASYVSKIVSSSQETSGPPPITPPPLPPSFAGSSTTNVAGNTYAFPPGSTPTSSSIAGPPPNSAPPPLPGLDAWDDPSPAVIVPPSYVTKNGQNAPGAGSTLSKMMSSTVASNSNFEDDFDDDWSDEDEEVARRAENIQNREAKEESDAVEEAENASEAEEQRQQKSKAAARHSLDLQSDLEAESLTTTSGKNVGQEFTGAHSFAGGAGSTQKMAARSRSTGPETASISISGKQQSMAGAGGTTRMKNLNRFSNFVKTGMQGYILATAKFTSQPGERHEIILANGGISTWRAPPEFYTCMVTKPKKESKLKGLKRFIAYSLTSSINGIQVSRRYKHFDWLQLQLANKYLLIPIPPLPEKQVAGRYEEDLIEHRRSILQLWVNKICRHPVLSQSEVWRHFMLCTDEGKWKKGKRQAERDEYVGGNFFNCISAPDAPLDSLNVERQIEQFARCSRSLEESLRLVYERMAETQKRLIGPYKTNWQKVGAAFDALGQSLEQDQTQVNNPVKIAIKTSAHMLHKIGGQHEEHGRRDLEQLLDFLFVTKGIYAGIPDVVNVHKSVLAKVRENEKLQNEGKISVEDADQIRSRVDVCSRAMLAEIQHQQEERDLDLATMFGAFFSQQAAFYHNIGNQLTQLAAIYKPAK